MKVVECRRGTFMQGQANISVGIRVNMQASHHHNNVEQGPFNITSTYGCVAQVDLCYAP